LIIEFEGWIFIEESVDALEMGVQLVMMGKIKVGICEVPWHEVFNDPETLCELS